MMTPGSRLSSDHLVSRDQSEESKPDSIHARSESGVDACDIATSRRLCSVEIIQVDSLESQDAGGLTGMAEELCDISY